MKKFIFCCLMLVACIASFASEYQFPGWTCNDKSKVEAALAAAPNKWHKFNCLMLQAVVGKSFKNFAELSNCIDAVNLSEIDIPAPVLKKLTSNAKKLICFGRYPAFIKDAYIYSLSNPSDFDIALTLSSAAGLTNKEKYIHLVSLVTTTNYNAKLTSQAVDVIIELAVQVDTGTQKEDLQKINRFLTPKVLKDKASWEPILSKVRTVLAAY